ncbi:MAG: Zn-dependent hydrolase [Myxococcota bacterium]|nr:Zn-dependent hydrolase [Myxococcota bacterium]
MPSFEINENRLLDALQTLAQIGRTQDGSTCRLAFTEADFNGRAQVIAWMEEAELTVRTDALGNTVGTRAGRDPDLPAVMTGSHIDTVRTGGPFDGSLGVLAGLEIIRTLNDRGIETRRPIEVGFFSNEEGSRFAPDMMGSLVYVGDFSVETARAMTDAKGVSVGDAIDTLNFSGSAPIPGPIPHAFLELHIEQGPVLDNAEMDIGVVTSVQGIRWQKLTLSGVSNHAGTTPMSQRQDAAYAAASIATLVRDLVLEIGAPMVGTVGHMRLSPSLVNVVANQVEMTVDLRHVDDDLLTHTETRFNELAASICQREGVALEIERMATFAPFHFEPALVEQVRSAAISRGLAHADLVSGAGHDAQIHGRRAPAAMIFVPSVDGISHNPKEHTEAKHLVAGTNLLLDLILDLAS